MKKILFITAFKPSKISAGENFTRLLLSNLTKKNIIDLVYFKIENESSFISSNKNINVIKEYSINKWIKLCTYLLKPYFFPVFRVRFNNTRKLEIIKLVNENSYDLIILDYGQCFEVGLTIKNRKLLIAHDVLFQRYSRHNAILGLWSKWTERRLLRQNNSDIFTFSEKDKQLISDNYKIKSHVTGFFLDDNVLESYPILMKDYFVFFARWSRKDNSEGLLWFFENVFPFLNESYQFKIIGLELSNNIIKKIQNPNVEILGFVENPYQIISEAKALIAPLFNGAGVKVKVIEALACGTPVIGSDISFEGIDDENKKFLNKCNSTKDYLKVMANVNVTLEERINFKKNFILRNNSQNILEFIKNL